MKRIVGKIYVAVYLNPLSGTKVSSRFWQKVVCEALGAPTDLTAEFRSKDPLGIVAARSPLQGALLSVAKTIETFTQLKFTTSNKV